MKLLALEDKLTEDDLKMFWALTATDYKNDIYKIVDNISFYLQQPHFEFFFNQIIESPIEKLVMEDFQCLSEFGKFTKDDTFKEKCANFFWKIISSSASCREDIVQTAVTKFCEMVKVWDMEKKTPFFTMMTQNLKDKKSSYATLKLYKGLIQDIKDKS